MRVVTEDLSAKEIEILRTILTEHNTVLAKQDGRADVRVFRLMCKLESAKGVTLVRVDN